MYRRLNYALASSLMLTFATALSSLPSTAQQAPATVSVKTVASGLTSPIGVVSSHDKTGRLFIIDQTGLVRLLSSDGTLKAYRAHTRSPSLIHFALFPQLIRGCLLSDIVAVLGSLNIIAAELDR